MLNSLLLLAFAVASQASDAPIADVDPPLIEDIAAAAAHPDAAPVVTVMMSDRGSGVGAAVVVVRGPGQEWQRVPLVGNGEGESALFIAHLPDGLQRTGFDYYVEASDRAGNGPARIGSPEQPIAVDAAREPTRARLERQALAQTAPTQMSIHPGFIMLGYGVGILGAAGAAGYLIDLNISTRRLAAVEDELASSGLSEERAAALNEARAGYQDAVVYDTAIAVVLGVVGVAGLVTGTALLIASGLE